MFYAYSGSYLTEFVIGYEQAFSHCTLYAVSAGVAAAIFEDNDDGEEHASTWKESWVLCAGYARGTWSSKNNGRGDR